MLDELVVRNLGVIREAHLEPGEGFAVITGETGAGKTLLMGALRLLTGGDPTPEAVGPFSTETVVEGRFLNAGVETVISRRVPKEGRSRAYLDGSPAAGRTIAEQAGKWVEIVGQHDQLSLTRPAEVRTLVDRHLDPKGRRALDGYLASWQLCKRLQGERDVIGGDHRALARQLDLVAFQYEEIRRAALQPQEDDDLEAAAGRLRNAETIAQHLYVAGEVVKRSHDELGSAVSELRKASAHDQDLAGVTESVAMAIEQASDIARQIRHLAERVNRDPQELERVESRLTLLGELRRKYGHNVEEINQFGKEAGARRAELAGLLARAETLGEDLQRAEASLADAASLLTAARRAAGKRMTTAALRHLHDLGFSDPVLRLEVNPDEPGPSGADRMTLLFASDSRLAPAEVGRVASGGELSRLVLALRLAGGAGGSATFAFDEIDAGVGGVTAIALGRKLKSLAVEHQVLCVTHLPQVAAHADTHFAVEREGNTAVLRRLEGEERRIELARMLAGMPESERGKEAADELLTLARAR